MHASLLWEHWKFDPFILVVAVLVWLHQVGLRRLTARARPERARTQRRQAAYYYGGLAVLLLSVVSPIDYWADTYFVIHILQHLLLMFAAPTLVVAGAPWLAYARVLPARWRRGAGRGLQHTRRWSWRRSGAGRVLGNPWTAVVVFNIVMVVWHLPAAFDLAETNETVHIWLMHGSFFAAGVLFWREILGSYPMRVRLDPWQRLGALVATNTVMWIMAMALGMFATTAWYVPYVHLTGTGLSPLADQRIGAGLLWICGDFWAWPALYHIVRHDLLRDDDQEAPAEAAELAMVAARVPPNG